MEFRLFGYFGSENLSIFDFVWLKTNKERGMDIVMSNLSIHYSSLFTLLTAFSYNIFPKNPTIIVDFVMKIINNYLSLVFRRALKVTKFRSLICV